MSVEPADLPGVYLGTHARWSDWSEDEASRRPRRACSVAGCKAAPVRVRTSHTKTGRARRWVFCAEHAALLTEHLQATGGA
jgi:hypothetical protein